MTYLPLLGNPGGVSRLNYYRTVPPTPFFYLLYSFYKYMFLKTPVACSHFCHMVQEWGLNSDCNSWDTHLKEVVVIPFCI